MDTTADKTIILDESQKVGKTSKMNGRDRSNTMGSGKTSNNGNSTAALAPIKEVAKGKTTKKPKNLATTPKNKEEGDQFDMTPGKVEENGEQYELRSQNTRKSFVSNSRSRASFTM